MARNKTVVPHAHFHKDWKRMIKLHFDQPFRKQRRDQRRKQKIIRYAPRPVELLRPLVHCPSARYHNKLRFGRGFSLAELGVVGINKKWARSVGIAVDIRRRNKSVESIQQNVQRLREYLQKLVIFPKSKKAKKPEGILAQAGSKINEIAPKEYKLKARVPTEEEKAFNVYEALRKARSEVKAVGDKQKRKANEDDSLADKKCNTSKRKRGRTTDDE